MQKLFRDPLFRLIVGSGGILLIFAALLLHIGEIWMILRRLLHVLRPLLLGILFATMLEPSFERLHADFLRFSESHRMHTGWIKPVSLLGAMLLSIIASVVSLHRYLKA